MKIVIVGGGASGLLSSILIKKKNPNFEVCVIDKNNKIGKKFRATGNGKANIANLGNLENKYSNNLIAKRLFNEIKPIDIINTFHSLGIQTISYGDYVYPYSESANSLVDSLSKIANSLGVKFYLNTFAKDYKNNILYTDKESFKFDKLIIASGLESYPKLGADSSFVNNLKNHNYKINKIIPSLTPIKTIEKTSEVNGIRRKVNVKVMEKNKLYFTEDGELLFKKDGLSGIVVFNATNAIHINNLRKPLIIVDFLPNHKFNGKLEEYFSKELCSYLNKISSNPKNVIFHLKDFYTKEDSIACIGGVDFSNLNSDFSSKVEKNVYIIGEAVDQTGICGGFNLMWAFGCAIKISKNI